MCVYIYSHIYIIHQCLREYHIYVCVNIYMYMCKYTCIYICTYISQSDVCLQIMIEIWYQGQITPPSTWIIPHSVLGKWKNASLSYARPAALFAPALYARFSPVRQCVRGSYCIYIHAHTCSVAPPPPQIHTKGVVVCMLTTIQTNTKKTRQKTT